MKDERRQELLRQFRATELDRFENSCAIPLEACQRLFDFLEQNQSAFDDSFHFTEIFAELEEFDTDDVTDWLIDWGAFNDADVLTNVKPAFEKEVRRLSK